MINISGPFQNKAKLISRRMFVLSAIQISVFFVIVARLFYLQISENLKYRSLSDSNRLENGRQSQREE